MYLKYTDWKGKPGYAGLRWQHLAVLAAAVVGWRWCIAIERINAPQQPCSATIVSPEYSEPRPSRRLDWPERR